MNWLDLVIIAIIVLGVVVGVRIGLLGAAITAAGAVVGWLLASQFSDDIARLFGEGVASSPWATLIFYATIILLALIVASVVKGLLLPALAIGTLGLSNLVDRVGGLLLGVVIGLVMSGALVMAMAGFAYNADLSDQGILDKIEEQLPQDRDSREEVEEALLESAIVPFFVGIKGSLPGDALGFVSANLKRSLDTLERNIEKRGDA